VSTQEAIMPVPTAKTADERYLVTGGTGCIGSWVVRDLVRESVPVVVLAADDRVERLRLILTDAELDLVAIVRGDVADRTVLEETAAQHRVNRLIHLAALQVPFCAADPVEGARVNVVGTVNVFETCRRLGIPSVVYASSAAVYGLKAQYPDSVVGDDAPLLPTTHYGVYKVANEGSARIYAANHGVSSIGLRPHSVYGPGRDQGMTSKPTVAMIAAAAGRPYHINFGGRYQFQFADDVARTFIRAARASIAGAVVLNVGGSQFGVDEVVRTIEAVVPDARGMITHGETPLALPEAFDGAPIVAALGAHAETALEEGIRQTIDCYRAALDDGRLGERELDRLLA
jgi:UDP-glucuronate 4-epimerase